MTAEMGDVMEWSRLLASPDVDTSFLLVQLSNLRAALEVHDGHSVADIAELADTLTRLVQHNRNTVAFAAGRALAALLTCLDVSAAVVDPLLGILLSRGYSPAVLHATETLSDIVRKDCQAARGMPSEVKARVFQHLYSITARSLEEDRIRTLALTPALRALHRAIKHARARAAAPQPQPPHRTELAAHVRSAAAVVRTALPAIVMESHWSSAKIAISLVLTCTRDKLFSLAELYASLAQPAPAGGANPWVVRLLQADSPARWTDAPAEVLRRKALLLVLHACQCATPDEAAQKTALLAAIPVLRDGDALFGLIGDQDDVMVEVLLLLTNMHPSLWTGRAPLALDPHELFVRLLRHVCFDATVLLDWLLTDEELLLLEYLLRYGRLAGGASIRAACRRLTDSPGEGEELFQEAGGCVDELQATCTRLAAKGLFPYDIRVLLPWLQRLRGAFEG